MKITVSGKEVDLAQALPMTVGDMRKLKKVGVDYPGNFNTRDPDHVVLFIHYFCNKTGQELTEDEVDTLTLKEAMAVLHFLLSIPSPVDRPTSGASIDLPTTTAGVQKTSTDSPLQS